MERIFTADLLHYGSDPATGSGWVDATQHVFPDWLEVAFPGSKTIDEISVFGLQDNYAFPQEPTAAMTGAMYGLSAFDVQYWTGSAWATVPGGGVTNNTKVWRKITFPAVTTTKVRVLAHGGGFGHSRVVELEAWGAGADARWLVTDHLGTPRMVVDATGQLAGVVRHDYLPFGEGMTAGVGGRTNGRGYGLADNVRQQFAGKERDAETELDYFNARYYSSLQGRFTSVDPINITGDRLLDPQQLNLYAYARNNPLLYIDPAGEDIIISGGTDAQQEAIKLAIKTLREQSETAEKTFALYDKPESEGPNLSITILEDELFDNMPGVDGKETILATAEPGIVVTGSDPNDVKRADAQIIIRSSEINKAQEDKDRKDRKETKVEGVLGHEVVGHAKDITIDLNGFKQRQAEAKKNNTPYKERPNEKRADQALKQVGAERLRGKHIKKVRDDLRF